MAWRRRRSISDPAPTHQEVNDINGAIKHIIDVLGDTYNDQDDRRVLYFDGWKGLGASIVLKAITNHFKSGRCEDLHFDIIIHIDCSMWKSKRAMQRTILEELKLDCSVMAMFDKQNELDDFIGKPDSFREEISDVAKEINGALENRKFLVIFHNGSDHEIDISTLGIPPLNKFSKSRMVWTYRGRFRTSSVTKEMVDRIPHVLTTVFKRGTELKNWHAILHEEATEVIEYARMYDINPAVVVDCFLYQLFLRDSLDWDAHTSNYWICDGIIQGDRAWEVGTALQAEMRCDDQCEWFDENYKISISERKPYKNWRIIYDIDSGYNVLYPQDEASSCVFTYKDGSNSVKILPNDLFEGFKKLCVLKLALCAFNFASPPFLHCNSLRLLCLDYCKNNGIDGVVEEYNRWPCFQSLWVLDLRYTDWDWILSPKILELMTHLRELNIKGARHCTLSHMQQWLPNVHKLRVMESSYMEVAVTDSLASMTNLVLLDLCGNINILVLPSLSSATSLKVLVLDGCVRLEHVAIKSLLLLESFSFDGYGPAYKWRHSMQLPDKEMRPDSYTGPERAKISYISLKGCARLENLFLRGLPNLEELDLSGTAVKSVDPYAMELRELKRLFLLSCEQLRWINLSGIYLSVLHVDTHRNGIVGHSRSCSIRDISVHLVFTNGRFLRSLSTIFVSGYRQAHLHISSSVHSQAEYNCKETDPSKVSFIQTRLFPYSDVFAKAAHPNSWTSPQVLLPLEFHIEIGEGSINLEGTEESAVLAEAMTWVGSLHVHDNSSITTVIPEHPQWYTLCSNLKWCHVERCPKLDRIVSDWEFTDDVFSLLETFWASHLLNAHCIFSKGKGLRNPDDRSFENLRYIHLDNCPRLRFVLPLTFNMNSLGSLETIHIEYCSELTHVFPMNDDISIGANHTVRFPRLKLVLLQELPKLQQICEAKMSALALETIKMRGCWSLRRLPAVVHRHDKPTVDCEKDCWDKLEWDNIEASHDPSLFKTRHSSYCKKTLSRISILR